MKTDSLSSYLELLPTSLTHGPDDINLALAGYLNIFEAILTRNEPTLIKQQGTTLARISSGFAEHEQNFGESDKTTSLLKQQKVTSFGQMIINAGRYSDPEMIPPELFVEELGPWLSRCLGVAAQQGWTYYQLKKMVKQIVPIYRIRTTKSGMQALFAILTGYPAQVIEILGSFGLGFYRQVITDNTDVYFCSGRLGTVTEPINKCNLGQPNKNSMVLGGKMLGNFFIINLTVSASFHGEKRKHSLINRVSNLLTWINEEKPVQTQFQLNYTTTPLEVGARGSCTVGLNSVLQAKKITRTINSWSNCSSE
ncbi:MAG: hypothetical protein RPS47_11530 [Colwellia sp.]|jgi:hypothetical protein